MSCMSQSVAPKAVNRPRKQSTLVCQAVAEQEAQTVSENEMRIAQDVSQLIGKFFLEVALCMHTSVCMTWLSTLHALH